MSRILALCLILITSTASAQFTPDIQSNINPWTHLNFKNDPDDFQFVIVSDHTGGHRPGVFKRAVRRVNLLQPEFVMCVGDLIEGYTEDVARLDTEWDEFESWVNTLDMPFFYVPGNHDISNSAMLDLWKKKFGRTYYHFIYKNVLFIQMDSEDPPSTNISDEQIAYVQSVLEQNKDVRWTLVFLHKPMWLYKTEQWNRVDALLKDRNYTVFAGHRHTYIQQTRHDRNYYQLATTGASSSLRGPTGGNFDHVTWVTMTDKGPVMANLMLDGILERDVRTEYTQSLTDPLFARQGVWASPLLVKSNTFNGDKATLYFRNVHADQPLKVKAAFEAHEKFRPEPRVFDLTVPPGEMMEMPVKIDIESKTKLSDLSGLSLAWTMQYDLPERDTPLKVDGKNQLGIEQIQKIQKAKRAPVIDGQLNDWKSLPFKVTKPAQVSQNVNAWIGAKDCAYSFAVSSDEQYLYLAVRTIDDRVVYGEDLSHRRKDAIFIDLDARPDPDRSNSRGGRNQSLNINIYPNESLNAEDFPEGFKAVCIPTKTGINAEIAVPVTYLNAQQGKAYQAVRLNVCVQDYDEGRGRGTQLFWRPQWQSGRSYAGTGTFVR